MAHDLASTLARHVISQAPPEIDPAWPAMATLVLADALRSLGLYADSYDLDQAIADAVPDSLAAYPKALDGARTLARQIVADGLDLSR